MGIEDLRIAAAIADKKTDALEDVMDTYSDMLLRIACLVLKDLRLAEDAVQETFIKFYYAIGKFRGEASIKTYLSSILLNECRQKLRKNWFKRTFLTGDTGNASLFGASVMEDSAEKLDLSRGLLKLDFKYREVLLLHYYNDLSIKEMADILAQSEGTVKSKLKRAREKLKIIMQEDLFDE